MIGLSGRAAFGDWAFTLGAELPLDKAVGAARFRGLFGIGFAPRFLDADHDGIEDEADRCPNLAEDRDGFEDSDGCPDLDGDHDGVTDDKDQCPKAPEDRDGWQDEDGCPDPDNDGDGVRDTADQCPNEAAPLLAGAVPGCPVKDTDGDGLNDMLDSCLDAPEDQDGYQDADGCPDLDNDMDGIPDPEDACPNVPGPARGNKTLHGCPSPDRDGDTFDDGSDRCPDQPETFDGKEDGDGCADAIPGAKVLARWEVRDERRRLVFAEPLVFVEQKPQLDPRSEGVLRAIAALLNQDERNHRLAGYRQSSGLAW